MFEKLEIFRMSAAMAQHAGQRQALIAQNVANADTPGYRGRDVQDFTASYMPGGTAEIPRATRPGHLHGRMKGAVQPAAMEVRNQADPNGNEIAIETEMLKAVDTKRQHDRALAIYRTALNVLRSSLRTN